MSGADEGAGTGTGIAVIHGWGCTPVGDPPPETLTKINAKPQRVPPSAFRGWKRTALYAILISLMVLIFLNIALTLWIITSLKLSMNGLGPIKIVHGGMELDGQAWVLGRLVASSLTSQVAKPVTMHSYRNFTILVSDPEHLESAKLVIKRDVIECSGLAFDVRDVRGRNVFHASKEEVKISADTLTLDGEGGLVARSAIQTEVVRAPPGSDLQLESLTRRLDVRAPQAIFLESRAGNIDISSHRNIKMDSVVGAIKIDAPNIIISNLREANITGRSYKDTRSKVYQLCACASGKLFLAAPEALCVAYDSDPELCR